MAAEPRRRPAPTRPRAGCCAIFDVFGEWFAREDFEGCSFINVMLEITDAEHPVRQASVEAPDRDPRLRRRSRRAGRHRPPRRPTRFARQWHILMKGSIVAAAEGDHDAGSRARELGALLLAARGVSV